MNVYTALLFILWLEQENENSNLMFRYIQIFGNVGKIYRHNYVRNVSLVCGIIKPITQIVLWSWRLHEYNTNHIYEPLGVSIKKCLLRIDNWIKKVCHANNVFLQKHAEIYPSLMIYRI